MPKLITILRTAATDVETFLDDAWTTLKPEIVSLGDTVLSQVEEAAETYVTSGGNFAEALASIMEQIPSDLAAAESVVAGYLATLISKAQAAAATATATSSAGSAGSAT